jgi:hypothetical protein
VELAQVCGPAHMTLPRHEDAVPLSLRLRSPTARRRDSSGLGAPSKSESMRSCRRPELLKLTPCGRPSMSRNGLSRRKLESDRATKGALDVRASELHEKVKRLEGGSVARSGLGRRSSRSARAGHGCPNGDLEDAVAAWKWKGEEHIALQCRGTADAQRKIQALSVTISEGAVQARALAQLAKSIAGNYSRSLSVAVLSRHRKCSFVAYP